MPQYPRDAESLPPSNGGHPDLQHVRLSPAHSSPPSPTPRLSPVVSLLLVICFLEHSGGAVAQQGVGRGVGGGRPKKLARDRQTERILLALTKAERRAVERAAGKEPVATFLRRLVLRHLAKGSR